MLDVKYSVFELSIGSYMSNKVKNHFNIFEMSKIKNTFYLSLKKKSQHGESSVQRKL